MAMVMLRSYYGHWLAVNGQSHDHLEFSLEGAPFVAAHESGLDAVRQQRSAHTTELRTESKTNYNLQETFGKEIESF